MDTASPAHIYLVRVMHEGVRAHGIRQQFEGFRKVHIGLQSRCRIAGVVELLALIIAEPWCFSLVVAISFWCIGMVCLPSSGMYNNCC